MSIRARPLLLRKAACAVAGEVFDITLDRLGSFSRVRVAWLAPSVAPVALTELQSSSVHQLDEQDFVLESRAYRPHVTLARKVAGLEPCAHDPVRFRAYSFALFHSRSTPQGVVYDRIEEWPLEAG